MCFLTCIVCLCQIAEQLFSQNFDWRQHYTKRMFVRTSCCLIKLSKLKSIQETTFVEVRGAKIYFCKASEALVYTTEKRRFEKPHKNGD